MAVGDEDGVTRIHHDQVVHPQQCDVRARGRVENDIVLGINFGNGAVDAVFVAFFIEVFRDGNPGADIVPIEGGLDVEHSVGIFHECVVDRDRC